MDDDNDEWCVWGREVTVCDAGRVCMHVVNEANEKGRVAKRSARFLEIPKLCEAGPAVNCGCPPLSRACGWSSGFPAWSRSFEGCPTGSSYVVARRGR